LRSDPEDVFFKMYLINDTIQGRTQREVGFKKPLELDILQKLCYLRKRDSLFSHTFCLLICRLNANNTEKIACKFKGTLQLGQKGFGGNLGYRLRPETISPLFADHSSTSCV